MAKQKGLIKLRGSLDGLSFYRNTLDGHLVREKGGVDGNRIATDPAYRRTRENMSEFGRAGKAGKVLRTTFRSTLLLSGDPRMVSRLTASMMKVIKADLSSGRGKRNVLDGDTELLNGFEFNNRSHLAGCLLAPYTTHIDRVSGELSISIPSFVPENMIVAPEGATHFKIISAGAEIDFEAETHVVENSESAILPWTMAPSGIISHTNAVTAGSGKPLFLVLGVVFYQELNAQLYPLSNNAFNPLVMVQVSGS